MAVESDSSSESGSQGKSDSSRQEGRSGEIICSVDGVADDLKSVGMGSSLPDNKDNAPSVKREKSGPESVIVPIILKIADFDHKALLEEEEQMSTRSCEKYPIKGLTVVNISATTFPQKTGLATQLSTPGNINS
ncbi:Hypothetical predicted protein [Olea europaea subsp. europaea]|uniref:Uncharacterized protein n=1 Tax=Olea europaea subsp. europaea TaxID=158383 RepID=A0A8S0RCF0_OLEEU|nr:Hypothetical predicted protein [Olea europaea subsp. europaea]